LEERPDTLFPEKADGASILQKSAISGIPRPDEQNGAPSTLNDVRHHGDERYKFLTMRFSGQRPLRLTVP
jgi:hypothetical protein